MTADISAPDPIAASLLPPLWLIVRSYATKLESVMFASAADLPMFAVQSCANMKLDSADLSAAVQDPDAAVALRWWHRRHLEHNETDRHIAGMQMGITAPEPPAGNPHCVYWGWYVFQFAAATCGNVAALDWAAPSWLTEWRGNEAAWLIPRMVRRAVLCNQFGVVKWAIAHYKQGAAESGWFNRLVIDIAEQCGAPGGFELLQWVAADDGGKAYIRETFHPAHDALLIRNIAEFGTPVMFDWVVDECAYTINNNSTSLDQAIIGAARSGNIAVLERINETMVISISGIAIASRDLGEWGSVEGLAWLMCHVPDPLPEMSCEAFASAGRLDLLQFAREQGVPWNTHELSATEEAASNGSLNVLQWAIGDGAPYDAATCRAAALKNGHTRVAEWIDSHAAAH